MYFAKIGAEQALGSAFKFGVWRKLQYMYNYRYFELVLHTRLRKPAVGHAGMDAEKTSRKTES